MQNERAFVAEADRFSLRDLDWLTVDAQRCAGIRGKHDPMLSDLRRYGGGSGDNVWVRAIRFHSYLYFQIVVEGAGRYELTSCLQIVALIVKGRKVGVSPNAPATWMAIWEMATNGTCIAWFAFVNYTVSVFGVPRRKGISGIPFPRQRFPILIPKPSRIFGQGGAAPLIIKIRRFLTTIRAWRAEPW